MRVRPARTTSIHCPMNGLSSAADRRSRSCAQAATETPSALGTPDSVPEGRRDSGIPLELAGGGGAGREGGASGEGTALGRVAPEAGEADEPKEPVEADGGRREAAEPRPRPVGSREKVGGGTNARRAIVLQHSADRRGSPNKALLGRAAFVLPSHGDGPLRVQA